MSLIRKILSAIRLLSRGDAAGLGRQWRRYRRQSLLRRQGSRPFLHDQLGFAVVCHPDWPESAEQFLDGHSDHWEFDLLRTWLRPGDQCLDLGANTGLYAAAALSAIGPGGLVVTVDAAPDITRRLKIAASLQGAENLRVAQVAVTDFSGVVTFYIRPAGQQTTEQSLLPAADQQAGSVPVTVPARTLVDLAAEHGIAERCAAVKIDIEGAEAAALRCVPPAWLGAEGPLWILEINPEALARFGATPADLIRQFPAACFDGWLLPKHPHDPKVRPALRRVLAGERYSDSAYFNFFAVPRGSRWRERLPGLARFFPSSP